MNEWKRVDQELPVIPKGKYGVSVLVCTYDAGYDEWNAKITTGETHVSSGYGCSVSEVSYSQISNRKGIVPSTFDKKFGDCQFMVVCVGYADDSDWIPLSDKVTHWMYLPKPPPYDTIWNEDKNRLEYIYWEDRKITKRDIEETSHRT